jgi:hypothetical protein
MSSLKKHKDFLRILIRHGKSRGETKKLIDIATKGEIDACCEIYLNVLKGNVHITPALAKSLKKHRKQCRELVDKKAKTSRKRKILKGQVGGFLPALIGSLAAPLLQPLIQSFLPKRR